MPQIIVFWWFVFSIPLYRKLMILLKPTISDLHAINNQSTGLKHRRLSDFSKLIVKYIFKVSHYTFYKTT